MVIDNVKKNADFKILEKSAFSNNFDLFHLSLHAEN
jgi:hypothetical protein